MSNAAKKNQTSAIPDGAPATRRTSFLLFRTGDDGIKAVPLERLERIEVIETANIALAGKYFVAKFHGDQIPLLCFGEDETWQAKRKQTVLVFRDGNREIGLVVKTAMDIIQGEPQTGLIPGQDGSIAVRGEQAQIVDPRPFFTRAFAGDDLSPSRPVRPQRRATRWLGLATYVLNQAAAARACRSS